MTQQIADVLIYTEKKYYIYAEPLSSYLKEVDLHYPLVAPNTACWRGYYAMYVVQNHKLFLTEWLGYIRDYMKVGMEYLFPGESFVFADWFTGYIPIEELGNHVAGNGPCSIYEGQLMLQFDKGILVREFEDWLPKKEVKRLKEEEKNLPF